MIMDEGTKKKAIIFFSIVVFLIIVAYAFLTKGAGGFWSVIKTVLIISVILIIVGALIYAGYKIFFAETRVDLVENDKQDIITAGTTVRTPLLKGLYFTGDKEHGESKIGRIVGYCQIQSYEEAGEGVARPEDCFIFKKFGFPFSLFEAPKVFRCYPEEHSQLIGDVRIYAISPIFKYGYYFPNHTHLNVRRIDESVVKEAYRGQLLETLKDLVTITKRATGLDAQQKKDLEYRKLLKIPSGLDDERTT